MPEATIQNIRNVVLLSHAGAGKTSLAEALLFNAGAVSRLGRIEEGNTTSDYTEEEIARRISISMSLLHYKKKENRVNIIDTPGYADFIGDALSGARAADGAVLLVCAQSGVETGTQKFQETLEARNLPHIIFVNKLDKENADFFNVVESLQQVFGKKCIPLQMPVGSGPTLKEIINLAAVDLAGSLPDGVDKEKAKKIKEQIVEAAAEADDKILEKYLEEGEISQEEMDAGLKKGIKGKRIIPILCGSATNNIGIKELSQAIISYLPPPPEEVAALEPETKEAISVKSDSPFSALVFKTVSDPYVGQLSLFRVYSGTLSANTGFYNVNKRQKERIGQIYFLQGKEQLSADKVGPGDIAAVAKLKNTSTFDSLSDEKSPFLFEAVTLPSSSLSFSIKPKTRADEEKISDGLSRLTHEDVTFHTSRDPQTKELIISGVGDLHLEIMVGQLKKRFGVEVEVGTPKVPYKETIRKKARAQGKYKKQSGGRGQYGDCWLEIEPLAQGEGFVFENKIVGGTIPRQYIPAVEKGVVEAMGKGVLAGYPVIDMKVSVYDGSYHTVDSSEMAFKIAASMAFKNSVRQANPAILEPIMNVEITIPEEFMGQITGSLNFHRGRVMGMSAGVRAGTQVIKATVPLAEMFKYATELRSVTSGQGSYQMEFSRYEETPQKVQQELIARTAKEKEEE